VVLDVTLAAGDARANTSSDVYGTSLAKWVLGFERAGSTLRFQAQAGHRYVVASREGLKIPRIVKPVPSSLKDAQNRAEYLVIAPESFLAAAGPLLERRASQGLVARAVSFEEIASAFGHGQAEAEAIREFVSWAYHHWSKPQLRYVLLFGDSSFDPRNFRGTSFGAPLPVLWTATSYMWTASDPLLGAVNGEDSLPDVAVGRLPATTVEQAERLVAKMLAWEETGRTLGGAAALVADNPDEAGDFEADARDIAQSYLSDRSPQLLFLSELGSGTRGAILGALDGGLGLLSYVGHGGTAAWASENVLSSADAASLVAQSQQPLLLTLNCLNGYFVAPNFESLSEAFLKVEGRGVIGAFSPTGLSLDGPAHQYHRAVMAELVSGRHERLGDAILAAQRAYALSGAMPELVEVYHLLGDPAMRIR
jgi:hypothetical protein